MVYSARGAATNAPARSCVRAPPPRDHNTEALANPEHRTRKTKEINFGFSFGGPSFGFPEPEQPAIVSETIIPPQIEPAPIASTLPPQEASSQPQSQTKNPQRTPGSARNNRPQRPSAYEIPPDDVPEQIRSNKRRKISRLRHDSFFTG